VSEISIQIKQNDPWRKMAVLWETVACGDAGAPLVLPPWVDHIIIHATGDFNVETLTIQGSIDEASSFFTLQDPGLNDITLAADGVKFLTFLPGQVRPSLSGTAGGDVDVYLFCRGKREQG